ncbi:MAG TPA: GerMN domain-containing protein [Vicinamibacterales bacterium]|nr:GerMN domain-containing protein [Vicinamibacterales bacterium]
MPRRNIAVAGIVVFAAAAAWFLFIGLPRWYAARRAPDAAVSTAATAAPSVAIRKITATLYYLSDDGMTLVPAQREIPFGASVVEQARAIIEAQIAAAPPRLSAIPAETKLRDVFITERGDAFVDLSGDIVTKHPGGSLDEIFTVYTLVNALTVNLPAVTRVQILIDGKEVDTLAGHVDLRHPLAKSLEWVVHDTQ